MGVKLIYEDQLPVGPCSGQGFRHGQGGTPTHSNNIIQVRYAEVTISRPSARVCCKEGNHIKEQ